jgi:hypothetical protein
MFVFNFAAIRLSASRAHDPDLSVPHTTFFPIQIPIVLRFHTAPSSRHRTGMARGSRFYHDVLEAFLEPVEADEDDEGVDEDGRAHASRNKHPDLDMYRRQIDIDPVS